MVEILSVRIWSAEPEKSFSPRDAIVLVWARILQPRSGSRTADFHPRGGSAAPSRAARKLARPFFFSGLL